MNENQEMSEQPDTQHVPVLLQEVVEMLCANSPGNYLDCTLGGGGHSRAILQYNSANTLISTDRDRRALKRAEALKKNNPKRFKTYFARFSMLSELFEPQQFDGVLADLGTSVDQLFEKRGFSFHDDNSFDMRMDEEDGESAFELLERIEHRELVVLLKEGGVGREASAIAKQILLNRPIKSAKQLAQVVEQAVGEKLRNKKGSPSTLVFQAIRMAVNHELSELKSLLSSIPSLVREGGRACIISFHSGEDKIVAKEMRSWESPEVYAFDPLSYVKAKGLGKHLTKKAIVPSLEEIERNPRSRSARLRVFEFRKQVGL